MQHTPPHSNWGEDKAGGTSPNTKLITLEMGSRVQIQTWHDSSELGARCGKMGTKRLHPSCERQLRVSKFILVDCQGRGLHKSQNAR